MRSNCTPSDSHRTRRADLKPLAGTLPKTLLQSYQTKPQDDNERPITRRNKMAQKKVGPQKPGPEEAGENLTDAKAPSRVERQTKPYAERQYQRGLMTKAHFRAAEEIELAYRIITGEVTYTTAKLEPKRDRAWLPADEGAARQLLQLVYSEWRATVPKRIKDVVFALIIEGDGVKETERRLRLKNNSARTHVIEGLDRFTDARKTVMQQVRHFAKQRQGTP